jgi:hypothetical protein
MHGTLAGVQTWGFFTEGICVSESKDEGATDTLLWHAWLVTTSILL